MLPYIFLYSYLILASLVSINNTCTNRTLLYKSAGLIIIIFVVFRGNGYDWFPYVELYDMLQHGKDSTVFIEYGFRFIFFISPSFRLALIVVGVISLWTLFKGFSKFNPKLPILGLLILSSTLLLPTFMGQIRQGLAIGIVSIAIWNNYKGERLNAFFLICLACLFHVSAAITIVILFVQKKQYSFKTYICIIAGGLILYSFALKGLSFLLSFFENRIFAKIMYYAYSENEVLGITSTIVIRITTLFLALYFNRDRDPKVSYLCNIYALAIIIYLVFGFIPQIAGRGSYYFVIYEALLVPYIVFSLRKKPKEYLCGYLLVIGLSIYRIISFFNSDFNLYSFVPYHL